MVLMTIIVIVVALLACTMITARLGFFKFAGTILGSMFKKPSTLMYPVVPREWQERTRGAVSIVGEDCIGCGICAKACPTNAIEVDKNEGSWTIQRMQCIQCSACVDSCPKKCLNMENLYTIPDVVKVVDTFEIPAKPAKKADTKAAPSGDGDLQCDKETCVFCGLCAKACPVDALTVDRKEKVWEVDKDTCVKCGACIDKCPKKCLGFGGAAEEAKEEPAEPAKKSIASVEEDKCIGCNACANACPSEAIEDVVDNKWVLKEDECVGCAACVDVCPTDAISMKEV